MKRIALGLAASILSTGCLSAGGFATPRTVAPREVSFVAGGSVALRPDGDQQEAQIPVGSFGLRTGLTEDLDLGGHITTAGLLRVDIKYNPLRSNWVDLAAAPGLWAAFFPNDQGGKESPALIGADVPLVLGVNLGKSVTLAPSFGPGFAASPGTGARVFYLRGSIGLRFRVADSLWLHPEIATLCDPAFSRPSETSFGFGFAFGAQPTTD